MLKLCHTVNTQGNLYEICIDLALLQITKIDVNTKRRVPKVSLFKHVYCRPTYGSKNDLFNLKILHWLFVSYHSLIYCICNIEYIKIIKQFWCCGILEHQKMKAVFVGLPSTIMGLPNSSEAVLHWKLVQVFSPCGAKHPQHSELS